MYTTFECCGSYETSCVPSIYMWSNIRSVLLCISQYVLNLLRGICWWRRRLANIMSMNGWREPAATASSEEAPWAVVVWVWRFDHNLLKNSNAVLNLSFVPKKLLLPTNTYDGYYTFNVRWLLLYRHYVERYQTDVTTQQYIYTLYTYPWSASNSHHSCHLKRRHSRITYKRHITFLL